MSALVFTLASIALLASLAILCCVQAAVLAASRPSRGGGPPEARARLTRRFLADPDRFMAATLLGGTVASAGLAVLATVWLSSRGAPMAAMLAGLGTSAVVLLLGELLPRQLASRSPESCLRSLERPAGLLLALAGPAAGALIAAARWMLLLFAGLDAAELKARTGRADLGFLFRTGFAETVSSASRRHMLHSASSFSDTTVREIMVPLTEVRAVRRTALVREALELARTTQLTRFPAYDTRLDEIVGVLNVYDILYSDHDPEEPVKRFMRAGLFVPNTVPIDKLLYQMQSRKMPLAIVVDEFGGADGIVTVKDVVDEVVGRPRAWGAPAERALERSAQDVYILDGHISLDRLNGELGLDLPKKNYETLSGFLMTEMEKVPEEGDRFIHGNLNFVVLKAKRHTIQKVQLRVKR